MPRGKGGKGKKKERFGKVKRRKEKRRRKKFNKALKSWKKDFVPEYFYFDPDRYPFYFPNKRKTKK